MTSPPTKTWRQRIAEAVARGSFSNNDWFSDAVQLLNQIESRAAAILAEQTNTNT